MILIITIFLLPYMLIQIVDIPLILIGITEGELKFYEQRLRRMQKSRQGSGGVKLYVNEIIKLEQLCGG
ncbi:hypothetical protein BSK56_22050 [Paenibacillus borealis]|uniref:Uncharacterized protein n=1 Tax=Paenibacillus borealis TaxID=160799 RepID=A0ABX3H2Y8_PAEBO|nr:hypothetical protein BSK56_22050 [Paenibacillus borealis]